MKKYLQSIGAVLFLALFLPYTMTLLLNGRQGIHQEQELPELEYQVLYQLLQEDYSWMDDKTLQLMAILHRTEAVRMGYESEIKEVAMEVYEETYSRMYQAVASTQGRVIMIGDAYRELPYHAVSAGSTREGRLLGEDYDYVRIADCSQDLEAEAYLQIFVLSQEEISQVLGEDFELEQMTLERDSSDYVTKVISGESEWQGEHFRELLHLPSSCFWMDEVDDKIRVTVKGNGHGFGISLYNADQMAREGAGLQEILHKFYENTECITIP